MSSVEEMAEVSVLVGLTDAFVVLLVPEAALVEDAEDVDEPVVGATEDEAAVVVGAIAPVAPDVLLELVVDAEPLGKLDVLLSPVSVPAL